MSLLCFASYCTDENDRLKYAKRTFDDLLRTVDFSKHRLGIYLNSPNEEATEYFKAYKENFPYPENLIMIWDDKNVGTCVAVNRLMAKRTPEETACKIDDDVIIEKSGWVDEMEEVLERMPEIYILGLKRKDLMESTYRDDAWKSTLIEVPHERGQKWFVCEACAHIMGTCVMFSKECLERVGGLYQMGLTYSFDDAIHSLRTTLLGKLNCFLHGISIDHIDLGGDAYTEWKRKYAGDSMALYNKTVAEFRNGILPIYMPFE